MNEKVKFWLLKAFEDYKAIKIMLNASPDEIPTSAVCFHAQQCV